MGGEKGRREVGIIKLGVKFKKLYIIIYSVITNATMTTDVNR